MQLHTQQTAPCVGHRHDAVWASITQVDLWPQWTQATYNRVVTSRYSSTVKFWYFLTTADPEYSTGAAFVDTLLSVLSDLTPSRFSAFNTSTETIRLLPNIYPTHCQSPWQRSDQCFFFTRLRSNCTDTHLQGLHSPRWSDPVGPTLQPILEHTHLKHTQSVAVI